MPDGRGFFPPDKEIFRGNPDGLQGKATQYGGKKTAQTAFNGCEYRFLLRSRELACSVGAHTVRPRADNVRPYIKICEL